METHTNGLEKKTYSFFTIGRLSQQIIFFILLSLSVMQIISVPFALLAGVLVANLSGHPYLHCNQKATNVLLQISVIGLGFGMNLTSALIAGKEGFLFAIASILTTLVLGTLIGKLFKIERKTAHLISCGTAICGGSAVAAIAPVVRASEKETSVALGTIFILNSIALFLFPAVGHWLDLSQKEFGLWCAIAIHDTSSVVGAANKYGSEALEIATTVKLVRALWIVPVALISAYFFKNKASAIKIPYFIGLFILAIVLNTYVSGIAVVAPDIVLIAKSGLTVTLFLIGAGLNWNTIKKVGLKPLWQGMILWIFTATVSLLVIIYFI